MVFIFIIVLFLLALFGAALVLWLGRKDSQLYAWLTVWFGLALFSYLGFLLWIAFRYKGACHPDIESAAYPCSFYEYFEIEAVERTILLPFDYPLFIPLYLLLSSVIAPIVSELVRRRLHHEINELG